MPGDLRKMPTHRSSRWLVAASLALAVGLLLLGGAVLWEMRSARLHQVQQASANVVATIEADIARNIELYDLSLRAVADNLAEPEVAGVSDKLRNLILFDRSATAKHLGSMHVLNERGYEVISSRTLDTRTENFSHRDYFEAHRDNPNIGLYIGKPFITPNHGKHVIGISRRLSHPDGSFAGVIAGMLRLTFFEDLFARVALDHGSSIGVFQMDGTMVTRFPFKPGDIGRNIGTGAEVFQRAAIAPAGQFETVASMDGVKRMYSYRRIGDLPMFVSVGVASDTVQAAWLKEAAVIAILVIVLTLATLALALFAARELSRRGKAEKELRQLASTDSLTSLYNRRAFDQLLETEWVRAIREGRAVALLMIDADHFKAYNDKEGHQAGDAALAAIACCIAVNVSKAALAARYGGEEFAVLLPGASLHEAYRAAENIRKGVADFPSMGQSSHPTVSIGITSQLPAAEDASDRMVAAADHALYEAKRKGRNRTASHRVLFVEQASRYVA
jgi:diguanylate cyclase (GGDEF)-like protein